MSRNKKGYSRNDASTVLVGKQLSDYLHSLFTSQLDGKRKEERKQKKSKKSKETSDAQKLDKLLDGNECTSQSVIEIYDNPSSFTVYSFVRNEVLEHVHKENAQIYSQSWLSKGGDEDSDDETVTNKEAALKLPKIVGLGVCGVFEIIKETRNSQPALSIRALQALLDMLQGQTPEGMKLEPAEAIDSLYTLLMELAVYRNTSSTSQFNSLAEREALTSLACACLASLVVARGDTGKYLQALSALLMSPSSFITQPVKVPHILTALQKSVHAVLLGNTVLPDWLSRGVRKDAWVLRMTVPSTETGDGHWSAIASDGQYLYVHNSAGLHKVGTGYGGTIKDYIKASNPCFHNKDQGWLAYAQNKLFYRSLCSDSNTLYVVDRDTLQEVIGYELEGDGYGTNVMFSDGETIGHIAATKDDSFVVRSFSPIANPMPLVNEISLKLAQKCLEVFGTAAFDPEQQIHRIQTGVQEDSVQVCAGKDFCLIRTSTGKVLFTGRSQSLGIKQGGPAQGQWAELGVTKSPKIASVAVGHEAQNALLLADDGAVFFVGMARKGEDGDSASGLKNRRQPKAVKPKKVSKLEGKAVSAVAVNSGTSAMVTRDGQLYMFGKDTAFCDSHTGLVSELKDVTVQSIVLGKAYAVALTSKGHVYTFGVNNKGQCGRDFAPNAASAAAQVRNDNRGQCGRDFSPNASSAAAQVSMNVTMVDEEEEAQEDDTCPSGKHKWRHDVCMVCVTCGECTGYGSSCVNSMLPNRTPGEPCGCGSGDSGCRECGSCRACAGEPGTSRDSADEGALFEMLKARDVIPLDLVIGKARKLNHLKKKLIDGLKQQKSKHKGEVLEPDHIKASSLAPGRVKMGEGSEVTVTQVACGLQHTVLLCDGGQVYTFGSNHYGQLGQGDTNVRGSPCLVNLKSAVVQVAAGSNHTVLLTATGQVFTFGNYKEGQLGRPPPDEGAVKHKKGDLWFASPKLVPNIGSKHGRRATAVFASGNQTFLKIDEMLIIAQSLSRSNVVANQSCIGLVPISESGASMKCLMISRKDGGCKTFNDDEQASLYSQSICIDPLYDLLWSYSPTLGEINAYNVLKPDMRSLSGLTPAGLSDLVSGEPMVPVNPGAVSTHSHIALHMLACLDTLTAAQDAGVSVTENEAEKAPPTKVYTKEDFSTVSRFETHGGGWGYSGHSIEAIRFSPDCDILLGGFGLFGGRGEYYGKIKLYDLGTEGEMEPDGELLAETDEMPYECGSKEKYACLFEQPVALQANRFYLAWARISGPSSDCGSSGQATVTTEDQVVFKFRNSRKSNNGTDVNAGQIPQLLYRLPSQDTNTNVHLPEQTEPAHVLSAGFSRAVSPECFDSLLKLLNWSWNTFCAALLDTRDLRGVSLKAAMLDLERLVYISTACLRLIKVYVNEVYPSKGSGTRPGQESYRLAECIGDTQVLLKKILADSHRQICLPAVANVDFQANHLESPSRPAAVSPGPKQQQQLPGFEPQQLDNVPAESRFSALATSILEECHRTFVACFHAFYPTIPLKWNCFCELLNLLEPYEDNVAGLSCLLAAVMEALCHPTVKLSALMPINYRHDTYQLLQSHNSSDDNNALLTTVDDPSANQFPVLVSHMMERSMLTDAHHATSWSFRDILDKLLSIVALPVKQALRKEDVTYPPALVSHTCTLLAALVSELSAAVTGSECDTLPPSRPLLSTPNRFTRTSRSAYWNTGNGTPDAVSFSVDRAGVLVSGVTLYGGGSLYEYEVQLLEEQQPEAGGDSLPGASRRWNAMATVRGSYSPDDCLNDVAEVKFDKPVLIKENVRYAVKLCNSGGTQTLNGDGGVTKLKCTDGTTFTFNGCSLSVNGTNHTRGQIPHILYYSTPQEGETSVQQTRALAEYQASKNVMVVASSVLRVATDLLHRAQGHTDEGGLAILGGAEIFRSLLPLLMAYLGPVVWLDPKSAVQTLSLIQEILPPLTQINSESAQHGSTFQNQPAPTSSLVPGSSAENAPAATCNGNLQHTSTPARNSSKACLSQAGEGSGDNMASAGPSFNGVTAGGEGITTSPHYAVIESDHPYKPATVANFKVTFPRQVQWMVLEFDPLCWTAQVEDTLQLYIPCPPQPHTPTPSGGAVGGGGSQSSGGGGKWMTLDQTSSSGSTEWWPVLKRFHGARNWPHAAVILPGHEVCFSLETASHYVKEVRDDKMATYGFKCLVVGYELSDCFAEGVVHLEKEVAYLGGMCTASLMRIDITLPPLSLDDVDDDYVAVDEVAQQVFSMHSELLSRGLALSQPVTISQALDGSLPLTWTSNERAFLRDFVNCISGTSGGRLAAWLQPESYLDYKQCDLVYNREELKCHWPATLLLHTKDQYGRLVNVPNLKVEVKAIPVIKDTVERKKRSSRVGAESSLVFGGHPPPKLDTSYQVTFKDKKDAFHAITVMKPYENYSFEELRYAAPILRRPSENMLVRGLQDGSYSCSWTPSGAGTYNIHVTLDGYEVSELFKVEVRDAPQGVAPPLQHRDVKPPPVHNKMRKFVGKWSAGLRVRVHPTLQSEQVGVIKPEGIIGFVDQIENNDGVWLRLDLDSVAKWCNSSLHGSQTEAWALQFNKITGKTLLVPVEEPRTFLDELKDTFLRRLPEIMSERRAEPEFKGGPGVYKLVRCGNSGHNIREAPSLKSSVVGMLKRNASVTALQDVSNSDGTWIRLDDDSKEQFCHDQDGECWALSRDAEGVVFLRHEDTEASAPALLTPTAAVLSPGFETLGAAVAPLDGFAALTQQPVLAFGEEKVPVTNLFPSGAEADASAQAPVKSGLVRSSSDRKSHVRTLLAQEGASGSRSQGSSRETSPSSALRGRPASPLLMALAGGRARVGERAGVARRELENITSDIPPELQGVSVKELIKALGNFEPLSKYSTELTEDKQAEIAADIRRISVKDLIRVIGESRVNGNGVTPPRTPPGTPKKSLSRSASPKPGVPLVSKSPRSSPLVGRRELPSSSGIPRPASPRGTPPGTPPPGAGPGGGGARESGGGAGSDGREFMTPPQTPPRRGSPRFESPPSPQRQLSGSPQRSSSPLVVAGRSSSASPHRSTPLAVLGRQATKSESECASESGKQPLGASAAAAKSSDESRHSSKSSRKDRGRGLRSKHYPRSESSGGAGGDSRSSSSRDKLSGSRSRTGSMRAAGGGTSGKVPDAMSPSLAQCIRAVFAAFMWHEGIVHDAMACASFLKFHPNLPKQIPPPFRAGIVDSKNQTADSGIGSLKKDSLSRGSSKRTTPSSTPSSSLQRHSRQSSGGSAMSISDASNINVSPSSTPSGSLKKIQQARYEQASSGPTTSTPLNMNEAVAPPTAEPSKAPPAIKLESKPTPEKPTSLKDPKDSKESPGSNLPPTLEHLVTFWEELSQSTLKVVQDNTILPSPTTAIVAKLKKSEKKEKDAKDDKRLRRVSQKNKPMMIARNGLNAQEENDAEAAARNAVALRQQQQQQKGGRVAVGGNEGHQLLRDIVCELCGGVYPHPVTYHMAEAHPGCGVHAGGQGYNSGGNFCGGWAGNCGDGGKAGSTWYLMCSNCRETYLKEKLQAQKHKLKKKLKKNSVTVKPGQPVLEPHLVMKNNAMFLLDLASSAGFKLPGNQTSGSQEPVATATKPRSMRLDSSLPSVSEDFQSDINAFPAVPFTFLSMRGEQWADSVFAEEVLLSDGEMAAASVTPGKSGHFDRRRYTDSVSPTSAQQRSMLLNNSARSHDLETSLQYGHSRSAEASPMEVPQGGDNNSSRILFKRSISEFSHAAGGAGASATGGGGGGGANIGSPGAGLASREQQHVPQGVGVIHDANFRVPRRRNKSGTDGGVSLLKHPSKAMTRLIKACDGGGGGAGGSGDSKAAAAPSDLKRPVLAFVTQQHDLENLQLAMRQALRKAMCRVFALQAFTWLLRSVTQPGCVHDLLWHFVLALTPAHSRLTDLEEEEEEKDDKEKKEQDPDRELLCEHPLEDIALAGEAVTPLSQAFHAFLQTISDVMMYLPPGSALQQMAVRCWCLKFRQSDHVFLHKCHVFSNISKILSKSDEGWGLNTIARERKQHGTKLESLADLSGQVEMKASSRQAMVQSLKDNSTETFWESGDEDRSKTKTVTITCQPNQQPQLVAVHIDNSRDLQNKVGSLVFTAGGEATGEAALERLRHVEVEPRFTGWQLCRLPAHTRTVRLEIKGPDSSLRLRQIKVLGGMEGGSLELGPPPSALVMQQQNCEMETLRVFRLLTSQVFGKLLSPGAEEPKLESMEGSFEDVDLREHMVGILFSRSKLTHLQKQVCVHIVQAIRKEATRVREEWESSLAGDAPQPPPQDGDAYCFELLSMVLALSGSAVGRSYLAQQHGLMQDLLTLLHTASPRVQRQVTALLRRVLPEVPPLVLANLLGVPALPSTEGWGSVSRGAGAGDQGAGAEFDPNRLGILDVFLACVAKTLTVQVKVKGKGSGASTAKSATTKSYKIGDCISASELGKPWWLRGPGSTKLANSMIELLKDLAGGKLAESWTAVSKAAIAENILALTRVGENLREPEQCIKTPTLWLAIASLTVLNQEHVERLSSGHYMPGGLSRSASSPGAGEAPHHDGSGDTAASGTAVEASRPMCDNHDDGETLAIIHCDACGNLCGDCDRFLHLSRKMRVHQRQVFKEEEEAIKVDLHEGCGRAKLFWVMCLADSNTHKAIVEFRDAGKGSANPAGNGLCRFCGSRGAHYLPAVGNVCSDPDCQENARTCCRKVLPCGHSCGGIADEQQCLPCLHGCRGAVTSREGDAAAVAPSRDLKQDADDMCMICFTEALAAAPSIQLACGHVFHLRCSKSVLSKRWFGPRITFAFSQCPICKLPIEHPVLEELLVPIRALYEDVRRKATMRLEYEGLHKSEAIERLGTRFHNDPGGFAMERYAYYVCFKCKKAYYGGEARCEEQAGAVEDYDPSELVCGGCSDVSRAQMCPKHGADFLEYKCRYCCSVAVFFCFGTTHFCNACHEDFQRVTNIPKSELPHCPAGAKTKQLEGDECPLHVKHPPTGEEFALGCGLCRNAHTF